MGPLTGLRVIELASIGPGPLCAMLLADLGADVIRIDRTEPSGLGVPTKLRFEITGRNRRSVALDIKQPSGPAVCHARNPGLVFGRMTGFGQTGPLAQAAGHDLNYIALTGALHAIGGGKTGTDKPVPPLNLVGDYGGGALYLAFGILSAIFERDRGGKGSGKGQVVDAAMVDGASSLMSIFFGMVASGAWNPKERAANILDGGTPFYDTYATSDGQWVSIGSLEPKFFAEMVERVGLDPSYLKRQHDKTCWPQLRADMVRLIGAKTRSEWSALLEGTDVCFAPVLRLDEVANHPHAQARNAYIDLGGVLQPAPAPRFSRSQPAQPTPPVQAGTHTDSILAEAGFSEAEIAGLRASGAAIGG